MKSLLENLAREQSEPLRDVTEIIYSEAGQVSVLKDDPHGIPAVLNSRVPILGTKKGDIEKGEDSKDKWS